MFIEKLNTKDFFKNKDIERAGFFQSIGNADTTSKDCLVYCDNQAYIQKANQNSFVSCVITSKELSPLVVEEKGIIHSNSPRISYYQLFEILRNKNLFYFNQTHGIGTNCNIHPSALISPNAKVGNNVTIEANAVIKDHVYIEDNAFVDVGAVLGNEGILHYDINGNNKFIRHAGGVYIGQYAAIMAHASIVKSLTPDILTHVGKHSIIGISSTIGHEAFIGENCIISGNCVIARQANVGNNTYIGTSCVVRQYVKLGEYSNVMAGSIVIKDVDDYASVSGNFAIDHKKNLRNFAKNLL